MDWFIAIQRWLYGGMAQGMSSTLDISGLPALMTAAFCLALCTRSCLVMARLFSLSYHPGRPGRIVDGLVTGRLLALTHVGIAVAFVLIGVAVISRSLGVGGRAPAFETASAALIALVSLYLVTRTVWPPAHRNVRDGKMLAVFTGLVPCPLTTFILTYALVRGEARHWSGGGRWHAGGGSS